MRVVLDTNVLLQAIVHKSRLRPIWTSFLNAEYSLHLTSAILLEYEELLAQRTSEVVSQSIISLMDRAHNAHFIAVYYQWNAITIDPDDNKFFDAAVAANIDYLVTNDSHFNEAKARPFPKVYIISADDFLLLLTNTN